MHQNNHEKHKYYRVVGDYLIDYSKIEEKMEMHIFELHKHNCSHHKLYNHCWNDSSHTPESEHNFLPNFVSYGIPFKIER